MNIIMKTATDRIIQAFAEKSDIHLDRETKCFAFFRFSLLDEPRSTVVRVHKSDPTFKLLSQAAA